MRQRAVDLLYAMCDRSNAQEIVQEMLNYLETADYTIREEMVRIDVSVSPMTPSPVPGPENCHTQREVRR